MSNPYYDRRGSKDAVYYDCDNADFEEYITSKGFKTDYGSFSDISLIAPELEEYKNMFGEDWAKNLKEDFLHFVHN